MIASETSVLKPTENVNIESYTGKWVIDNIDTLFQDQVLLPTINFRFKDNPSRSIVDCIRLCAIPSPISKSTGPFTIGILITPYDNFSITRVDGHVSICDVDGEIRELRAIGSSSLRTFSVDFLINQDDNWKMLFEDKVLIVQFDMAISGIKIANSGMH